LTTHNLSWSILLLRTILYSDVAGDTVELKIQLSDNIPIS